MVSGQLVLLRVRAGGREEKVERREDGGWWCRGYNPALEGSKKTDAELGPGGSNLESRHLGG